MVGDLRALTGRISERFKRRWYGKTFRCPVCHLELAVGDLDDHHLIVCPLCGVVLEVEAVYGHQVPVVLDLELFRPQPTLRLHPLATHLPIGLYPFALLGALGLLLASLARGWLPDHGELQTWAATVADTTLALLVISIGASLLTLVSGLWDWRFRFRGRRYRQISLKIVFSLLFVGLGTVAVVLQASGWVFAEGTGLVELGSPASLLAAGVYLAALMVNMVLLATLGHVGGTLVFGR